MIAGTLVNENQNTQLTVIRSVSPSIVRWHNTMLVGFQNHIAKDGADGKFSTIVQYSLKGEVMRTFSVPGHNDGLRLVGDPDLWALQNEDANPNLVVIDFDPGTAYLASDTTGTVGVVNLDNEIVTPVATGFGNARGLLFIHKMHSKHQEERGE